MNHTQLIRGEEQMQKIIAKVVGRMYQAGKSFDAIALSVRLSESEVKAVFHAYHQPK